MDRLIEIWMALTALETKRDKTADLFVPRLMLGALFGLLSCVLWLHVFVDVRPGFDAQSTVVRVCLAIASSVGALLVFWWAFRTRKAQRASR